MPSERRRRAGRRERIHGNPCDINARSIAQAERELRRLSINPVPTAVPVPVAEPVPPAGAVEAEPVAVPVAEAVCGERTRIAVDGSRLVKHVYYQRMGEGAYDIFLLLSQVSGSYWEYVMKDTADSKPLSTFHAVFPCVNKDTLDQLIVDEPSKWVYQSVGDDVSIKTMIDTIDLAHAVSRLGSIDLAQLSARLGSRD